MTSKFQYPGGKALLVSMCCFIFTFGMGGLIVGDVASFIHDVSTRRSLLEFDHHTSLLLLLLPFAFSVGLLALLSKPVALSTPKTRKTAQQRTKESREFRWGQWYVLFILISILLALFSPIPQFLILNHLLSERGYVFCPAPLLARNPPDRWALPGSHGPKEHCPREDATSGS